MDISVQKKRWKRNFYHNNGSVVVTYTPTYLADPFNENIARHFKHIKVLIPILYIVKQGRAFKSLSNRETDDYIKAELPEGTRSGE